MADEKISAQADGAPLVATDELIIARAGDNKKVDPDDFVTYVAANAGADFIDLITEIAAALKTGTDGTLVTGTAGTSGNLAEWNADGDAIDSSLTTSDVVTGASTDTFTNKTFDANGTGNSLSNVDTADATSTSGSDTTFITGTAGTSGVPAEWNGDGDIVDATDTYKIAGKETIWIPATAMTPATTAGPATGQTETSTNKVNFETLAFDKDADEFAHFPVMFPKSYNLGTVTFQVVWTAATGGTTGIAFGLQGVAIGDNVTSDTAYGTAVVVTDDAQTGALEVYVSAESAAVTIGNTPADDKVTFFRLLRDISDANDDLAEDALLIGIKLHFTTDAKDDT